MLIRHLTASRHAAFLVGCAATLLLLTLVARRGVAEKQQTDDCYNHNASLCRLVETCTPKGFEANGSCKWNYTASRSYWKN